jgi:hypothetical protein
MLALLTGGKLSMPQRGGFGSGAGGFGGRGMGGGVVLMEIVWLWRQGWWTWYANGNRRNESTTVWSKSAIPEPAVLELTIHKPTISESDGWIQPAISKPDGRRYGGPRSRIWRNNAAGRGNQADPETCKLFPFCLTPNDKLTNTVT